jgi:TQXA domain-containing protein
MMTILALPRRPHVPLAIRRRERPGGTELARLTRYRGGTFSHTVDSVVFTDGTVARTDLIRLNPNVEAYSLDFSGVSPTRPSHYRVATWSAVPHLRTRAHEAEVDWILRNSFPTVGTAELSRRLRGAGFPLNSANVAEHEAIAATQAAIWFFTNDLQLDDRARNEPVSTVRGAGSIAFEFEGLPQLGGFTVDVDSDSVTSLSMQKSSDGEHWRDVAGSGLAVTGPGRYRKVLGLGSTMSQNRPGRRGLGYRYYRLVTEDGAGSTAGAALGDVQFWLEGSAHYGNQDRIVHLYRYLLAGAQDARRHTMPPELSAVHASVDDGHLGPFRLHANDFAALSVSDGVVVDADGGEVTGCLPGAEFYVRPHQGVRELTVTATTGGAGGHVVTGVARDEVNNNLTPVALAVPAPVVVDFHLSWQPGRGEVTSEQALLGALGG